MTTSYRGFFALALVLGAGSVACSVQVSGSGDGSGLGGINGSGDDGASTSFGAPQEPVKAPAYESHCTPAQAVVAHAVCVCGDMSNAGSLTTEASGSNRASVGVNGRFSGATGTHINGSLHAGRGVSFAGLLDVADHLYSGDSASGSGTLHVGESLLVDGNLSGAGTVEVGGALRVRGNKSVAGKLSYGSTAPFVAAPASPCTCDKDKIYDVAHAVDVAKDKNDNAAANVPVALGAGEVHLKSGRYYFSGARSIGSARIVAEGAVQVYVDGDVDTVGSGQIRIERGATLDLFVKGSIRSAGDVSYGDASRPEAFRLYVGGPSSRISFAGSREFHGLVYAPEAELSFAGDTVVNGALLAKSISYAGDLKVTYAPVTTQSETCEEPAPAPAPSCEGRMIR